MYMAIALGGNCVTWTTWKSTIVCQNNKRRVPKERLARISARGKVFKFNERLGALSGHYGIYHYNNSSKSYWNVMAFLSDHYRD